MSEELESFLLTNGWWIMVIIAAIAALAYFGVLNPGDNQNLGRLAKACKEIHQEMTDSRCNAAMCMVQCGRTVYNVTMECKTYDKWNQCEKYGYILER